MTDPALNTSNAGAPPVTAPPAVDPSKVAQQTAAAMAAAAAVNKFEGHGVIFKAKMIGEEDVPEPRGDAMCQISMQKLKQLAKQAGGHKQKVMLKINFKGLQIVDLLTQATLFDHPVPKISFISRDTTDSRAFGCVVSKAEGDYRFFAIKTEKSSEAVVLALRDLFQAVIQKKKQSVTEAPSQAQVQQPPAAGEPVQAAPPQPTAANDSVDSPAPVPAPVAEVSAGQQQNGQVEQAPGAQPQPRSNLLDLESDISSLQMQTDPFQVNPAAVQPVSMAAAPASGNSLAVLGGIGGPAGMPSAAGVPPAQAQGLFGAQPVAAQQPAAAMHDPFKTDPFFTSAAPAPAVTAGAAPPAGGVGASNPFADAALLQPHTLAPAASQQVAPSQPAPVDRFAALDPIAQQGPPVAKRDFWSTAPKPSLNQLSGTSTPPQQQPPAASNNTSKSGFCDSDLEPFGGQDPFASTSVARASPSAQHDLFASHNNNNNSNPFSAFDQDPFAAFGPRASNSHNPFVKAPAPAACNGGQADYEAAPSHSPRGGSFNMAPPSAPPPALPSDADVFAGAPAPPPRPRPTSLTRPPSLTGSTDGPVLIEGPPAVQRPTSVGRPASIARPTSIGRPSSISRPTSIPIASRSSGPMSHVLSPVSPASPAAEEYLLCATQVLLTPTSTGRGGRFDTDTLLAPPPGTRPRAAQKGPAAKPRPRQVTSGLLSSPSPLSSPL